MRSVIELVENWSILPPAMVKWVNGRCADYALALIDTMPSEIDHFEIAVLARSGPLGFGHVGLKIGEKFLDIRGFLTAEDFVQPFGCSIGDIEFATLEDIERSCGITEPDTDYNEVPEVAEAIRVSEGWVDWDEIIDEIGNN